MMLVSLVVLSGVGGGYFFNVVLQGVTPGAYFEGATSLLQLADLVASLVKAWVFGFIAAIVACYKGMNCERGPAGVGRGRQPVGRAHVHPHLHRQLRDDDAVLRPRRRNRVGGHRPIGTRSTASGPSAGVRRVRPPPPLRRPGPRPPRRRRDPPPALPGPVAQQVSNIAVGSGAWIFGSGMVFVVFAMSFFTGTEVGLQGVQGPGADRGRVLHRPGGRLRQRP